MVAPRKPCMEKTSSAASRIASCFSFWIRVAGRLLAALASALWTRLSGALGGSTDFSFLGAIFVLRERTGVLTFFQLVKNLGFDFNCQAPANNGRIKGSQIG